MSLSPALHTAVAGLMQQAAARAILPRFQHLAASEIFEKAADDLVTVADRESEAILAEGLARLIPGAAIVGEEAVAGDPTLMRHLGGKLCWIIDPLDGTNNFAAGRRPFGMLVALAEHGRAVAGWIYDPVSGRLCHAAEGGGAFADGEAVTARSTGEISMKCTCGVKPNRAITRSASRAKVPRPGPAST